MKHVLISLPGNKYSADEKCCPTMYCLKILQFGHFDKRGPVISVLGQELQFIWKQSETIWDWSAVLWQSISISVPLTHAASPNWGVVPCVIPNEPLCLESSSAKWTKWYRITRCVYVRLCWIGVGHAWTQAAWVPTKSTTPRLPPTSLKWEVQQDEVQLSIRPGQEKKMRIMRGNCGSNIQVYLGSQSLPSQDFTPC